MRWIVVAVALLGLAGCDLDKQDDARCQSYGLSIGDDGYAQCRLSIQQQRDAAMQNAIAIMGAESAILAAQHPPPPRPVTCMAFGNMMTCQ